MRDEWHEEQLDEAVAEVFALMLERSCTPANQHEHAPAEDSLSACVAFSGSLNGTCAVHLATDSVGELTGSLIGEIPEPGSPLVADTAGELCNMIAGSWKSRLDPLRSACLLSAPTVVAGPVRLAVSASVTRHYRFAQHTFALELTLF